MVQTEAGLAEHLRRRAHRAGQLSPGLRLAYGAGALVSDTANFGLNTLLLFYLTVVCGMSGAAAGAALGAALILDAFVDPLVGSLSDGTRARLGRRHPFMLASTPLIVIAFVILFSIPQGLAGGWLAAYALCALLIVRIGMSGFAVPYIALGAELSDNYAERSRIVAGRVLFTVIAGVCAAILAYGVFFKGPGGQLRRDAYPPFALSCAVLILAGAAISTFGTLKARHRLHPAPTELGPGLAHEVAEVFRNRSFRILFSSCLVLFIAAGVAGALALHANTYFWNLPSQALLAVSLASMVGILIGVIASGALAARLDKRAVTLGGLVLIAVCQFAPVLLALSGLVHGMSAKATLIGATAIAGMGTGAALVGFQSMMADAADEHEHLFGARREGLYFAGISFSAKASSGLGALIAGVALDLLGFPSGAAGYGPAVAAAATHGLGLVYGPGAAVLTCVSIAMLAQYRRSAQDHAEVQEALGRARDHRAA